MVMFYHNNSSNSSHVTTMICIWHNPWQKKPLLEANQSDVSQMKSSWIRPLSFLSTETSFKPNLPNCLINSFKGCWMHHETWQLQASVLLLCDQLSKQSSTWIWSVSISGQYKPHLGHTFWASPSSWPLPLPWEWGWKYVNTQNEYRSLIHVVYYNLGV